MHNVRKKGETSFFDNNQQQSNNIANLYYRLETKMKISEIRK